MNEAWYCGCDTMFARFFHLFNFMNKHNLIKKNVEAR